MKIIPKSITMSLLCLIGTTIQADESKIEKLLTPVVQTGEISLQSDVPTATITLMGFIVKQEQELKLSPEQVKSLAKFRKSAKPKRIALEKNITALHANLRQAMIDKAPKETRDAIFSQILATKEAVFQLRSECIDLIASQLSDEQYSQLMDLYKKSAEAKKITK